MTYVDLGGLVLFLAVLAAVVVTLLFKLVQFAREMNWRDMGEFLLSIVLIIVIVAVVFAVMYVAMYVIGYLSTLALSLFGYGIQA